MRNHYLVWALFFYCCKHTNILKNWTSLFGRPTNRERWYVELICILFIFSHAAIHSKGHLLLQVVCWASDCSYGRILLTISREIHTRHAATLCLFSPWNDKMGSRHLWGYQVGIFFATVKQLSFKKTILHFDCMKYKIVKTHVLGTVGR